MSRNQTDFSQVITLLVFSFLKIIKKCVFGCCFHFDVCGLHFRLRLAARWTCNSVERGQQRSTFPPGGSPPQRLAKVTVRWSDVWQLIFFFFNHRRWVWQLSVERLVRRGKTALKKKNLFVFLIQNRKHAAQPQLVS